MVSRNIDTRMTYVIGISLVLGLSKDVYRAYFDHLPAFLHPLTGSMLSLTLIVALVLNLLFRIGIRRRDAFVFEDKDLAMDKFAAFLQARGKTWSVSGDMIERATSSTMQVLEHISSARLVQQGMTRAVVSYDELQLLIEIDYEGSLLTLPNVGVRRRILLEEESFSYGLADFLTGVYPDRMESSARGAQVTIRLYFTA
jgi:NCS2 family nucleobase:cation symporter-2